MYPEFEIIDKIAAVFETPEGLTLGIGDDCAILDPGRFDLVTTDTLVEGIHFDRRWSSASDIGWKSLAVCLSDIAAMGGGPGAFFLNLSLPQSLESIWLDDFLIGMKEAATLLIPESFDVAVGGGDVTGSPGPIVITVTMLGEASPAGPVTRTSALPGDRIAVLGPLGLSRGGLEVFQKELSQADYPTLVAAHRRPQPRVREGALLGLYGVPSAMIDISDGLLQDLGHILKSSNVGATIEVHNLLRNSELHTFCSEELNAPEKEIDFVLSGGDDYELAIVVPPARMTKLWDLARLHEWDVYDIGEIRSAQEGLRVLGPDGDEMRNPPTGYEHFS